MAIQPKVFLSRFFTLNFRWRPLHSFTFLFGHVFFILLGSIAVYTFLERMLPFDSSFFVFKIIHFKQFNVEADRYGVIPSQILPVLGVKLGWSLETILKLYSLNFVLVQYILFLIVYYLLKKPYAALALILSVCVGYRMSFYYTVSEIHETIAPSILLFAVITSYSQGKNLKYNLLFALLVFLSAAYLISIHKLAIVLAMFIAAYAIIHSPSLIKNIWFVIPMSVFFVLSFIFIASIDPKSYEGTRMIKMENIKLALTNLNSIPAWQFFKKEYHTNYYLLSFVGVAALLTQIFTRQYLKALLLIAGTFGLFLLQIAYDVNPSTPHYYQNYYCLWGVLFSIPFCIDLLPRLNIKLIGLAVVLISLTSLYKIFDARKIYRYRIDYVERVLFNTRQFPGKKFIVHSDNAPWSLMWTPASFPFESLFISSLKSPDSARTFCVLNAEQLKEPRLSETEIFYGIDFCPFWFQSPSLNPDYFRMKPTLYQLINTPQSDSLIDAYSKDLVSLHFPKSEIRIPAIYWQIFEVDLTYWGKEKIGSWVSNSPFPLQISYHLYSKKGELIKFDNIRTSLESDLIPGKTVRLGVTIDTLPPGEYILEADLLNESKKWWGINERCFLTVYKPL